MAAERRFQDLLPDDLHQNPFSPSAVELAVEDLLPGTEIQFSVCDRNDHFPSHDLALHVSVGIVFSGVMTILGDRLVGRKFFEPDVIVVMQS